MAIQPNIALMFHPDVPVEDVLSQAKKVQGLRSMMTEDAARQQQILQSRQQVEESKAQMDNYQAQAIQRDMANRDQEAWTRLYREAKGDWDTAFKAAAADKNGPSAGFIENARKLHEGLITEQSKRRESEIKSDEAVRNTLLQGGSAILDEAVPDDRKAQRFGSWIKGVSTDPSTRDAVKKAIESGALTAEYNKDSLSDFVNVLRGADGIAKAALERSNLSKAKADELQSGIKGASETAPESVADTEGLQRWYAAQTPSVRAMLGPVESITDDRLHDIRMWAVPADKRPEVMLTEQQFKAMESLDDAAIESKIAALIPESVRDAKAIKTYVAAAKEAAANKDYKEFRKVLGDAARYSTGVDKSVTTTVINMAERANSANSSDVTTPETYRRMAEQYIRSGERPPATMGDKLGKAKFNNAVTDLMKEWGITPREIVLSEAGFAGDKATLSKLKSSMAMIEQAEGTAGKNLANAVSLANKILDTGSPMLNAPLRKLAEGAFGSTGQQAYDVARQVATNEVARVLSQVTGSGSSVLSDSARKEAGELLAPGATLKQILTSARVIRQDMDNRKASIADVVQNLQGHMGLTPAERKAAEDRGEDDSRYKVGQVYPSADGKSKAKYMGGRVDRPGAWEVVQ